MVRPVWFRNVFVMRQPATPASSDAPSGLYLGFLAVLAGVFLACAFLVTGAGAMFEDALHPDQSAPTTTSTTTAPPTTVIAVVQPTDGPGTDGPAAGEPGIAEVEGGPDEAPGS